MHARGWIYVDMRAVAILVPSSDCASGRASGQPARRFYSISGPGSSKYLNAPSKRLRIVMPATLAIIFLLPVPYVPALR